MYTEPLEMTRNPCKSPKFATPESVRNINEVNRSGLNWKRRGYEARHGSLFSVKTFVPMMAKLETCRRLTCNRHSVCVCGDIIDYVLLQIAEKEKVPLKKKEMRKLPEGKEQHDGRTTISYRGQKRCQSKKKGFEGTISQCRKLQYTKIKWILETPYDIQDEAKMTCPLFSEIQEKEGSEVIALDPDVRTFMTGYDPSGIAVEWGKNDIGQLSHIMSCYVTYSQEDPLSL
ncbi:unnamed protein product [Rhizophagus irregularis]|nr:unnamed protein product [Rhizophagus irregularis]